MEAIFSYVRFAYLPYDFSMQSRTRSVALFIIVIALISMIVMLAFRKGVENVTPSIVLTDEQRTEVERIIYMRINTLSPTPPTLGSKFYVRGIEWNGRGNAIVRYDDGESQLQGRALVEAGTGGRMKIEEFELMD